MINLPDHLDLHINGIFTEDVAACLRDLRAQGLLGAFLCHPEVLGDALVERGLHAGDKNFLDEYCPGFCDGYTFIIRLQGNSVASTSLSPPEPPEAGACHPVETFHSEELYHFSLPK